MGHPRYGRWQKAFDKQLLRALVPTSAFALRTSRNSHAKPSGEIAAGRPIFKEGEHDNKTIYVLEGEVELYNAQGMQEKVVGAGPKLNTPSQSTTSPSQRTHQDSLRDHTFRQRPLDILLTWDQVSGSRSPTFRWKKNTRKKPATG